MAGDAAEDSGKKDEKSGNQEDDEMCIRDRSAVDTE